jgi:ZIP family zinc transporter
MPVSIQAGLWGLLAGSALIIGALLGYFVSLPQRLIASVMAFGSGTLISALAFDLMDEAYTKELRHSGNFDATAIGFVAGAAVYTAANWVLARYGAKHRKRSGEQQRHERQARRQQSVGQDSDGGLAIAVGALLDGIPESIVIGTSMIAGGAVSWVAVVAVFLSNVPEGLSSVAGMKKAGRGAGYIFGIWIGITLASGIAAWAGCAIFRNFSPDVVSATTAIAAGAILAMLADTMMPEAFEYAHNFAGLITVLGFLAAFILSKWGG